MKVDEVTIVVPTKNEERNIAAFLQSIPPRLRLIVADASQDNTPQLIHKHRPQRTHVIQYSGLVTQARQVGAELAQTEWLLFTDADVVFAPDYFERLTHYKDYDVVYGTKISQEAYTGYYRWFTRGQRFLHRVGVPAASGSNTLIKRRVFVAAGGFDLTLTVNEDSELVWRVKRHGFAVHFDPELVVHAHDHRRLQRGAVRKMAHSLIRCFLLYTNLMPERWRSHDWGYWKQKPQKNEATTQAPSKG